MNKRCTTSTLPIVLSSIFASAALGDIRYSVQALGTSTQISTAISPISLNDEGQITGYNFGVQPSPALIWQNGNITNIPLGQANFAEPLSINNKGLVVGNVYDLQVGESGFLYDANQSKTVTILPGLTAAASINDLGNIAGITTVDGKYNAAVWTNGQLTNLAPTPGQYSAAVAINDRGVVAGMVSSDADPDAHFQPVVWQGNQMTHLATLGGPISEPTDINNRGTIIGDAETSDILQHAIAWQDGVLHELKELPGDTESGAIAINNDGQIVGFSETNPFSQAVLWEGTQVIDLNNLLPANSGWDLQQADDINNEGQIVGLGTLDGVPSGFLLTPDGQIGQVNEQIALPEPATGLLLLASLPFLQPLRRRRRATSN